MVQSTTDTAAMGPALRRRLAFCQIFARRLVRAWTAPTPKRRLSAEFLRGFARRRRLAGSRARSIPYSPTTRHPPCCCALPSRLRQCVYRKLIASRRHASHHPARLLGPTPMAEHEAFTQVSSGVLAGQLIPLSGHVAEDHVALDEIFIAPRGGDPSLFE